MPLSLPQGFHAIFSLHRFIFSAQKIVCARLSSLWFPSGVPQWLCPVGSSAKAFRALFQTLRYSCASMHIYITMHICPEIKRYRLCVLPHSATRMEAERNDEPDSRPGTDGLLRSAYWRRPTRRLLMPPFGGKKDITQLNCNPPSSGHSRLRF